MSKSQKRKTNEKQTKKGTIFSTSMADTKSIIENNSQLVLLHEKKLNNYLKKNRVLMETIVLVNFIQENQNNLGVLNIIHEHSKDLDSESLIISAIDEMIDFSSELNIESILNTTLEIDVLEHLTDELLFEPTISINESVKDKMLIAAKKLIEFQNRISEAA